MDSRPLPNRLARSRWIGLLIGAIVLIAWALFLANQLDELRAYPWDISPSALIMAMLWSAIYFGGLAYCWALLLRHMSNNPHDVSLHIAARIWLLSMMTRYIPGNVWHILSRVALANEVGVARTTVLSSATIEQLLTILGAMVVFALTLPLWDVIPAGHVWWLLLIPCGLVLVHPLLLGRGLRLLAVRFRRPELAWDYTYPTMLLLIIGYSLVTLCSGLALYTLLWGLTPITPHHLPIVLGASSLAWTLGYLSFLTPSGLGVREGILVALLMQIYPLPIAIVGSLLHRLVSTLGELIAVGIAWGYGHALHYLSPPK